MGALCKDESLAPFEKNRKIIAVTRWMVSHILPFNQAQKQERLVPLLFFHKTFGVPKQETLQFMSGISVVMYERSLVAGMSGVVALWLGYSDKAFLSEFVGAVFCEEVGSGTGSGNKS